VIDHIARPGLLDGMLQVRIRALPCPRKGLRPPEESRHNPSIRWTLFCPS